MLALMSTLACDALQYDLQLIRLKLLGGSLVMRPGVYCSEDWLQDMVFISDHPEGGMSQQRIRLFRGHTH